jgi:hypothetical protein
MPTRNRFSPFAFVAAIAALAFSTLASADPPSRVARLGEMNGAVSFSPAGENDWVQATLNRPLTTGDRLWADAGARAEIQIGGAMIRMDAASGVSILNLDDQIAQLQLSQGTLNVRVRRVEQGQTFEIDTPNLAFTVRQPGEYRIEVDAEGNATMILVRSGQGEVYGEGASYVLDANQPYRFTGTGLRDYEIVAAPRLDEFDRWSTERDRSYDNSTSARYVSPDVVGYQDLDANGTWRADANYGNVWIPSHVAAGWTPYQDGHWAWIDPWGWTWVDDAPWGYAVSHYGRWTNLHGTWGWVPGPVRTRAYYAPALVAFVGGSNFQLAISSGPVGGVAWFPLGPREVYRPSYAVSRGYFENVNRSNTVINTTVINNYYNNTNVTNVVYANRQVPGAVVAVPTTAFVQSQPVAKAIVRVTPAMVASAPVASVPSVAPTERSVRGPAVSNEKAPPPRVFERAAVAHAAPPPAHVGFAAQQPQLNAAPGKPLDDAARKQLKPAAAAPAPPVKVVVAAQAAPPTLRPPAVPPSAPHVAPVPAPPGTQPAQSAEQRGKPEQRGPAATPAPAQQVTPPVAATPPKTPPPVPQPPEMRGKPGERGQPMQPPAPPPQPVAEPKAVTPVVPTPPAQHPAEPKTVVPPVTAQPGIQRPVEPKDRSPAPVHPVEPKTVAPPVTPPPPMPHPAEPKAPPPQSAPPAPVMQPPVQRAPQPAPMPPPQAAPRTPPVQQPPPRAEPAQAAKAVEARPPGPPPESHSPPVVQRPPAVQAQPAPNAQPKGPEARPAVRTPEEKKKEDDQKREEDARKQKG